jgi:UDP-N-acetylmuramate dehydrogenase
MPQIHVNFSLKHLNTFRIDARCRWYTEINTAQDLIDLFSDKYWFQVRRFILGGGSNVLLTQDYEGLVIKMNIRGIEHELEGDSIYLTAGAGEVWNDLVTYCVDRNFAGLENLTLIPGSVGASPIQNIGAYGVELKDVFYSCEAFEVSTGTFREFTREECEFGYRNSVFKSKLKGEYIITKVTFKLSSKPVLNTTYGAIEQELNRRGILSPTIRDISEVVAHIRVSKLPDPSTIGNAGSFFKNPVISDAEFRHLQSTFPDIVHFLLPNGSVKLAAGWLIEQCGWKGKKIGQVGTWKNQALVLVNHGDATGNEVFNLSEEIVKSVQSRFNVILEREVNIL